MNETVRMWMESIFNVSYLIVVWTMVVLMTRRMGEVASANRKLAELIRNAFFLLALGDTGHVGFRVVGYAIGGLDTTIPLFGISINPVGVGALATAITVTFFYMLMVLIWQIRYNRTYNWASYLLLAAGVVRLIIVMLPGNEWGSPVPPQPMGLYRNLPLMVQGLGIMGLIFYDAFRKNDTTFKWIAAMIALSYAFYTPVILFVDKNPLLGMLMIPKTCAYLGVAFIAYAALWKPAPAAAPVKARAKARA